MTKSVCPLPIHSLAEAHLYLTVTRCDACDSGPLAEDETGIHYDPARKVLTVPVTCKACGKRGDIRFDTSKIEMAEGVPCIFPDGSDASRQVQTINPTEDPSQIIDVAGWLTLFSMIAEAARVARNNARKAEDRVEVRRLQLQAGQCLDEALKFYELDNDLPSPEAFFSKDSRHQFRERPELFSRQRLIELHAKLPLPLDKWK